MDNNRDCGKHSKTLGWVVGVLLLCALLTFRSFEIEYVFYFSWIAEIILVSIFIVLTLISLKIDTATVKTLGVIFLWIIVGALLTSFAHDINEHLKILVVSSFYMISSLFFVSILVQSRLSLQKLSTVFLVVWTAINTLLLFLFLLDIFIPAKAAFSGLFHDRNVFAITTLLVVAFFAGFSLENKTTNSIKVAQYFCIVLCFLMIIISRSVTGFSGLLMLMVLYSFRLSTVKRIGLLALVISIAFIVLFTENFLQVRIERFVMAITGQTEMLRQGESAYLRLYLLENGAKLAMDNLFVGVGINNASDFVIWPTRDVGSFLHNTYLDILTGGGIPLFIAYYGPIFYSLYWLIRKRRKVFRSLPPELHRLWTVGFIFLLQKIVFDLTWTTYFEFFMVFSVIFGIYVTVYLKGKLRDKERFRSSRMSLRE